MIKKLLPEAARPHFRWVYQRNNLSDVLGEHHLQTRVLPKCHWYCQSSSLTEYATFFCFLSMEFIAELPYKSPRLSGCFHTFYFLSIILKTFQDPTTATVTRSSKTYNKVNIKNNFARTPPFLYIFFAVTAYLRRENA